MLHICKVYNQRKFAQGQTYGQLSVNEENIPSAPSRGNPQSKAFLFWMQYPVPCEPVKVKSKISMINLDEQCKQTGQSLCKGPKIRK